MVHGSGFILAQPTLAHLIDYEPHEANRVFDVAVGTDPFQVPVCTLYRLLNVSANKGEDGTRTLLRLEWK